MKQKSSLKDRLVGSRYFSFGITLSLFVLLYVVGMMNYRGFMKPQVFCNLLIDNAALIIATIGITFVLLIGGIDISIGSVVALTCMSSAQMLQNTGLPAPAVILIVLAMGAVFGLVQGWLITEFNMQPFIVTLAGQFFARGMTAIISRETIVIDNPVYTSLASARIYVLPGGFISVGVVIALVTLVAATLVLKFTRFGRNIYALGGNEMSAQLMGLPTKRTKILAYVVCGFCSALAGVVYSLIMLSGYPLHAVSMEMDAIASSVIGGTLMSGGVAFLPGTLLGVLIQGVIQSCEILIQQADAKIDFIGESPVYVWADEFKTEQVIRNYLTNAIHHVDNERRIEVRVLSKDDIVRVTVFNSGHPIPQEDLAKLWDKFYKVDKAHTREYGGNGIGLSIVKAIMESFHQKYGVRNFDNGVEFWFELDGKSALHEEQNAVK